MIVYGYAKATKYSGDGTLLIQVRIPNIHGPYRLSDYKGKTVRNYTQDQDLPWYQSVLLPYLPGDGAVVAISSLDGTSSNWLIIGLTGGSYQLGVHL
jgi:hypothetical protein